VTRCLIHIAQKVAHIVLVLYPTYVHPSQNFDLKIEKPALRFGVENQVAECQVTKQHIVETTFNRLLPIMSNFHWAGVN
jgi:hypothetical protein